jgi:hypothetical protein
MMRTQAGNSAAGESTSAVTGGCRGNRPRAVGAGPARFPGPGGPAEAPAHPAPGRGVTKCTASDSEATHAG